MATIIQLNPPHRTAAPPTAGEAPTPCEIVIFPGVRIERHEMVRGPETSGPDTDGGTRDRGRPRKSS